MKNKTIIFMLISSLLLGLGSCKKKDEKDVVCKNLLKHGKANKELLNGKWKLESFAYTLDGKKIEIKEKAEYDALIGFENQENKYSGKTCGEFVGKFTIQKQNKINLIFTNYYPFTPFCHSKKHEIESDIFDIKLRATTCFSVNKEKLFLYATSEDDINLLILKRID